jgi:hypothetical protein
LRAGFDRLDHKVVGGGFPTSLKLLPSGRSSSRISATTT